MASEPPPTLSGGVGRAAVGGVAWNLGGQILDRLIGFAAFAIVVRLLTVELAGVVMLAASAIDVVAVLAFAGVGERIIQHQNPDQRMTSTAFWVQLSVTLLLAGAFAGLARQIARLLGEDRIVPLLYGLACVLVPQAVAIVPSAMLARRLRYRELTLCALTGSITGAACGIVMATSGHAFWAMVTQRMVASVVYAVLAFVVSAWRPILAFDGDHARETIRFAAPLVGSALTQAVQGQASTLVIGAFLPVEAVAYFRVAARVGDVLWQFSLGPVTRVFLSVFSILRSDKARARRAFINILAVVACVTYGSYALIAGTATEVMILLFGLDWAPAGPVFVLMALAAVTLPLGGFVSPALTSVGRTGLVLVFHLTSLAILLATLPIAAQFGLLAVLYTAIGRSILTSPLPIYALHLAFGLGAAPLIRTLMVPLISALAAGLAGHAAMSQLGGLPTLLALTVAWSGAGCVFAAVHFALAFRRSIEVIQTLGSLLRREGRSGALAQ